MELTTEHQMTEGEAKPRWRQAFFALYAPFLVFVLSYAIITGVGGFFAEGWGRVCCFAIAGFLIIGLICCWPRFWRMYREIFQRKGSFDHPTVLHLTDRFFEVSCGENQSKQGYGIFTHYFCLKDCIALLHKRTIMGVIDKKHFPDGGTEWMRCLEANGVKRKRFWELKRWLLVLFLVLVMASMLTPSFMAQDAQWCQAKAARTACLSNMKTIRLFLAMYASDYDNHLPPSLRTLFSPGYCENPDDIYCPSTDGEYKYVPYRKLPAPDAESSACIPILLDSLGSHCKTRGLLGRTVWQTPVLFADGHISLMENLCDYMEIHDQCAEHISPEDAEVLEKCCEAWNRELWENLPSGTQTPDSRREHSIPRQVRQ